MHLEAYAASGHELGGSNSLLSEQSSQMSVALFRILDKSRVFDWVP